MSSPGIKRQSPWSRDRSERDSRSESTRPNPGAHHVLGQTGNGPDDDRVHVRESRDITTLLATAYLRLIGQKGPNWRKQRELGQNGRAEDSSPPPQIPLDSAPPLIADGTLAKEPQR